MTLQRKERVTSRLGRLAMCVSAGCAVLACVSITGCKSSDVLTELLFDQNAQNVDEDNASRFLDNVASSLDLTEDLPQLEKSEAADLEREQEMDRSVQGDGQDQSSTPKTEYEPDAPKGEQAGASGNASADGTGKGTKRSTKSGKKKKPSDGGKGDGDGKGDGVVYKGDGGTGAVYNENGKYEDLPTGVQTVVAFGEYANMVVSFAGEHALSGADKDFLSNSFIKAAYKKKDISNAKTIPVSKKGVVDAEAVAKLGSDAVLLDGTSCKLSASGLDKLKAANIDVVYLPAMTSAARIKNTAKSIGKMFGKSTLSGDDAAAAADTYVSWHDSVVDDLKTENGGLAGSVNFETGASMSGTAPKYTLYLSQWDNATYSATPDNHKSWTDKNGVGISQVGYKWSPMSYYLSVGGTQNVSATFKQPFYDSTAKYYVWQFNLGRVPSVYDKNWSNRTVSVNKLSNSGTSDLLVKAEDGATLGSPSYSYVVARTQSIASKMKRSRDVGTSKQTGLYGIYKTVAGSGKGGTGFLSATGQYCSAAISGKYDVVVNPSGLYSSWVDGSPESVLESVWINDVNDGTSKLSSAIKDYYELFYDVKLTSKQVKTIENGLKE